MQISDSGNLLLTFRGLVRSHAMEPEEAGCTDGLSAASPVKSDFTVTSWTEEQADSAFVGTLISTKPLDLGSVPQEARQGNCMR